MKVLKYGGSSLANLDLINKVARAIKEKLKKDKKLIIVASAMGKTTNQLLELINKSKIINFREQDQLLATGEMQSVALLANALTNLKINAISLSGWQAGIETDEDYSKAFIKNINKTNIFNYLKKFDVVVVAGFQGFNNRGDITTLGRGGSDTTAVALASVFNVPCEIYTDVSAVCTVDPKIFPRAKKLVKLSYDEIITMSNGGAKVLETRCTEIAKKFKVDLYLGKSLEKIKKGTYIVENNEDLEYMPIKSIAVKSNLNSCRVLINGKNHIKLIQKCLENKIDFETISITDCGKEKMFNFYFADKDLNKLTQLINNYHFKIDKNLSKLTLIGLGVVSRKKITLNIFEFLHKNKIEFSNVVVGETALSFSVKNQHCNDIVSQLAKKFQL